MRRVEAESPPTTRASLGGQFKDLRVYRGLSQSELSRQTGIPRSSIGDFEKGRANFRLSRMETIASALDSRVMMRFPATRHRAEVMVPVEVFFR